MSVVGKGDAAVVSAAAQLLTLDEDGFDTSASFATFASSFGNLVAAFDDFPDTRWP